MVDTDRQQIRDWAAQILTDRDKRDFANELCAYAPGLPTHSVRSQMLAWLDLLEQTETQLVRKSREWDDRSSEGRAQVERLVASNHELREQVARLTEERDQGLPLAKVWKRTADQLAADKESLEAQVLLLARTLQNLYDDNECAFDCKTEGPHVKCGRPGEASYFSECVYKAAREVLASLPKPAVIIVDPSQMSVEALQSGASEESVASLPKPENDVGEAW